MRPRSVLRELALLAGLASAAFVAGFIGYLAVGAASPAVTREEPRYAPVAAAPASDLWNLPKRI
jgi:hypothetical protein